MFGRFFCTTFTYVAIAASLLIAFDDAPVLAQERPIEICEKPPGQCVAEANRGRIGLISGSATGTYIRIADDIRRAVQAYALADGPEGGRRKLRVVPMIGLGSVRNVDDLLYFNNTDVGLVQADLLVLLRQLNTLSSGERFADVIDRIRYLAPVYNEEVHVVCRRGVCGRYFGELVDGIIVNLGSRGSGTELTARLISTALEFPKENFRFHGTAEALRLMGPDTPEDERVDVMFFVGGKPLSLLQTITEEQQLELVELTERPRGLEVYVDAVIDERDGYDALLGARAQVRTLAVPAVLAVYGGNYRSRERADNLRLFCRALVDQRTWLVERAGASGGTHRKWEGWDPSKTLGDVWVRHPFMEEALAGK